MKIISLCSCFIFTTFCFAQEFPKAKKTPVLVSKHGISFADDYPWMEDMRSTEMADWIAAQNTFTDAHFAEIGNTYASLKTIKKYDAGRSYKLADRKGAYFFYMFRKQNDKSSSLYVAKSLDEKPLEIINPNLIYDDKVVSITKYFPSKTSKLLSFKIAVDGSDRQEIRFYDFKQKKQLDDVLQNVKFSNVSWNGEEGIFYKKNSNRQQFAKDSTFQLMYHKIGTLQEQDKLVFDDSKTEGNILSFFTASNKLFIIEDNKEETLKNYYVADLDEKMVLDKFIENDATGLEFLSFRDNRVYFSSKDYDWGEIRSFDLKDRKNEKVIIPQIYTHLLVRSYLLGDYIVCKYKTIGKNYLLVYDYSGKWIRKIEAPQGTDLDFSFFDAKTKELFYTQFSYVMPNQNFKINIETGEDLPFFNDRYKAKANVFPFGYFETKTITYKSRDNVDVPITIVYKKGLPLDGNNPTILKAYGGFGKINAYNYDTGLLYFLENGGVFAYAEIRGNGDKGKQWHLDGTRLKKNNTFNDFIDAAEFLIAQKYTSPNKLAITGGSQGGLLVGVAMTQRPELFKVAVPEVGVFDMSRFSDYTVGRFHNDEYGDPENEDEYQAMMAYSPYQNIKEDVNYPVTLILTSENDDRVPPVHSYKFAARLQNRAAQKNPVYIKIARKSGHSGNNTSYDSWLQSESEFYGFILYHLNQ
ncbi:MAG: prolyl oligopeptidase family serine peptidase [Flavobacterium sp.]|nr:prolyl oligopeptidase family serine peptidase [Flavobacterium sp.]